VTASFTEQDLAIAVQAKTVSDQSDSIVELVRAGHDGLVEYIGGLAAVCTTLCWVPQALKIVREKQTQGISLVTQAVFTIGIALWLAYGLLLHNWPILLANAVTLVFTLVILILKVRYP